MKVKEVMTTPVFACDPRDTVSRAAGLMWDHDCGAIPVIDHEGHVVGMITDRDVCMAAYEREMPLERLRVAEVMTNTVAVCGPNESVAHGEELMRLHQVRRLPVVDDSGVLVGILSLNDLALEAARDRVPAGEVFEVLAAVCAARAETLAHRRH